MVLLLLLQDANGAAPIEEETNLRKPIGLIMTNKFARLALFAVVALLSNSRALRAQGREIAVLERALPSLRLQMRLAELSATPAVP